MAESDNRFEYESFQDTETIVKYLRAITEGFTNGRLTFGGDSKKIVLKPKGLLSFQITAKRKRKEAKLTLRLSWKEESNHPGSEDEELVIETTEPKPRP